MDDDDADYMQGSEDEVCVSVPGILGLNALHGSIGLWLRLFGWRRTRRIRQRRCRKHVLHGKMCVFMVYLNQPALMVTAAKKEDNPEEALKEFRAIVDQEVEKGDWFVFGLPDTTFFTFTMSPLSTGVMIAGVSRHSSNLQNFSSLSCEDRTMHSKPTSGS
jgi:hypothetical protein